MSFRIHPYIFWEFMTENKVRDVRERQVCCYFKYFMYFVIIFAPFEYPKDSQIKLDGIF